MARTKCSRRSAPDSQPTRAEVEEALREAALRHEEDASPAAGNGQAPSEPATAPPNASERGAPDASDGEREGRESKRLRRQDAFHARSTGPRNDDGAAGAAVVPHAALSALCVSTLVAAARGYQTLAACSYLIEDLVAEGEGDCGGLEERNAFRMLTTELAVTEDSMEGVARPWFDACSFEAMIATPERAFDVCCLIEFFEDRDLGLARARAESDVEEDDPNRVAEVLAEVRAVLAAAASARAAVAP